MKTKKMLSLLLAMVLSTSTLTGCSNVNTLTKLPLNNNIQIVDKELENKEEITLDETKKDETLDTNTQEVTKNEETKVENKEEVKQEAPKKEETKKEEVKQETPKKEETKKETKPEVTFNAVEETVYAKSDVNVRKGPSTDYSKVGVLKGGKTVTRTGIGSNGWSKVIFDGQECYINSSYLTTSKPEVEVNVNNTSSYPLTYSDGSATITIYKEWYKNAYCYAAHIKFSNYSRLATSCANGKYGNGTETTSHAAKRLGAILAINGCYSSKNLDYIVVRDGKIWNGKDRNTWLPAVYSQNTGKFLSAWETGGTPGVAGKNVSDFVSSGLFTDSFCFGPPILSGGSITAGSDSSRAQRTFMGTNGNAGDIWLVVSDGRYNDGKSAGLTYKEMASYLQSKGCTFGIPLDGGGSSTMVFQGKVLNAEKGHERAVVDFVYFK